MCQGNGETKRREEKRRKNCTPTDTLFVVNFDPETTQERDLEKHFSSYGRLKRVQVKRNFGFVQFESLDDAIAARNGLNLSRLLGTHKCMLAFTLRLHITARKVQIERALFKHSRVVKSCCYWSSHVLRAECSSWQHLHCIHQT